MDELTPDVLDAETLITAHAIMQDESRYREALSAIRRHHNLLTGLLQYHAIKRADHAEPLNHR